MAAEEQEQPGSVSETLARWIATGFGLGAIRYAPGTFGTLLAVPLYLLIRELGPPLYLVAAAVAFVLGLWACGVAERRVGIHDHPSLVWDEVVGFLATMILAPAGWIWLVAGFLLFRLFDIWKPYPIRTIDRQVPGAWGTMLDDLMAAVYAWGVLQVGAYWMGVSRLG